MNNIFSRFVFASGLLLGSTTLLAESAIIVHPSNNSVLTVEEISDLFLGKSRNFSNGNRAIPVTTAEESETKQAFNEKVLKKSSSQLNKYWSKLIFTGQGQPPKALANDQAIKQQIAVDANVIGIVDAKSVDESVKVVYRF